MEYKQLYPTYKTLYAESYLVSVIFSRKELLSYGVDESAHELNELYVGLDEFNKLRELWLDPLYLEDFYFANSHYFRDPYWGEIDYETFINDVISSAPLIFEKFAQVLNSNEIDSLFEPLGKEDEDIQDEGVRIKVKSKFGKIGRRIAFRIYAIKVDDGCYVVTGGAIKIVKKMPKAHNTAVELKKLKAVYRDLGEIGNEKNSFVEFLLE